MVRKRRLGERGKKREKMKSAHLHVSFVGWQRGGSGAPLKNVGWRAVGGGAYRSSSPGEIIGGLVGTLVSKT